MTSYRQKRKAPPGQAGRARADTAGGQLTASTVIISQSERIVKPESAGAVVVYLRPGQAPEVEIRAFYEADVKRLQFLAARAMLRLLALEGVLP